MLSEWMFTASRGTAIDFYDLCRSWQALPSEASSYNRVPLARLKTFVEVNKMLEPSDPRRYIFSVVGAPGSWSLVVGRSEKMTDHSGQYVLESQRGLVRTWKTADGVIRYLDSIGVPRHWVIVLIGDLS